MIDREKEISLLHLDNLQKRVLENIISKFLSKKPINPPEIADSFVSYLSKFMEASAEGTKDVCDELGNLSSSAFSEIQKFCDAIRLCSGVNVNFQKILSENEIRQLVARASSPRNRHTMQRLNELEYRVKISLFAVLESNDDAKNSYMESSEDIYMSSLTAINPLIMKNAFIEHMVDMISSDDDHTISDVMRLVEKYSKYLGTDSLNEEVVEELMHKYSDVDKLRDLGGVHAARIEVFKILEGENK